MALFKPFRGSRTSLDAQPLHDGYAYFCIDDGTFHIDYVDEDGNLQRKQINAKEAESLIGCDITQEKIAKWDAMSQNIIDGKGDKAVQQVLDATSWAPDADQEEIAQSSAEQSNGNLIVGALGQFSFMEGGKSQAKGKRAHAEGTSTVAVGNYSHSEGNKTGALGTNSHAEGLKSVAQGSVSHAEGSGTKSVGEASHTEGANTVTQGYASHAEGDGAQAIGNSSHAEGYEAIAHGVAAHAEGRSNEAHGDFSHAEGMYSHANGEASHAGGRGAYTNAYGAFAHGDEVLATADFQTVFGRFNETDDEAAFIVGNGESDEARINAFVIKQDGKVVINGSALNIEGDKAAGSIKQTTDYASGTFGVENIPESVKDNALIQKDPATGEVLIGALGDFSSAFGGTSQASGKRAHAEGTTVVAAGKYSHAEGNGTVTLGNNTHAEGFKTIAEGPHSHAEGFSSHAVGEGSHAEGYNTKAEATNAHAEGSSTQALGTSSHSEGYEAIAQGTAAHAEGRSSVAQGNFSHAEGMYSHADGEASHAGGRGSYAYEPGSFAHGDEVVANVEFQTVFGRFNELDDEAAFIIGNGEDKENRNNLFTVKKDGKIYVNGEELSAASNVFFAEYGVTTRNEILAAYQAGKACMCQYEGYVYNLCSISEVVPYIFFSLLYSDLTYNINGPRVQLIQVFFDDWATREVQLAIPSQIKDLNIECGSGGNSVEQTAETTSWTTSNPHVQNWINNGIGTADDGHTIRSNGYVVEVGAYGKSSFATGGKSQTVGKKAHVEGSKNIAFENNSHAEGNETFAAGKHSHAEGNTTAALGNSSHAEGANTLAKADASHAEGVGTNAIGAVSHAEGQGSTASGEVAHAEGMGNSARGYASHAEGAGNVASGRTSHAEGDTNKATGDASHAGGALSEANHAMAFAHGAGAKTGAAVQAVFGEWNAISSDAMFVVGGGTAENDRKNIFEVKKNGEAFLGNQKIATLADINNAGGEVESNVFIAEYGTTTEAEIDAALNAGKACFCHISNYTFEASVRLVNAFVPVVYGPTAAPFITFGAVVPAIDVTGDSTKEYMANVTITCRTGNAWSINVQKVPTDNSFVVLPWEDIADGSSIGLALENGAQNIAILYQYRLYQMIKCSPNGGPRGSYSFACVYRNTNDEIIYSEMLVGYHIDDTTIITDTKVILDDVVISGGSVDMNLLNSEGENSIQQKLDRTSFTTANELIHANTDINKNENGEIISGAFGAYSSIFGGSAQAKGKRSQAFGSNTVALGGYSHAEGNETFAAEANSHAEGLLTSAWGLNSHAEGHESVAVGAHSHAEGHHTIASGVSAHAEGEFAETRGDYSHAEGHSTCASGISAHAEGKDTAAIGENSHSEGYLTTADGENSHSEGKQTVALGENAHTEGEGTRAYKNSHAEGKGTTAKGDHSHSEGTATLAEGESAHAEGNGTSATGNNSHSEGLLTSAIGVNSHAEGHETEASGTHSHAEGDNTTASGQSSHAEGAGTEAHGSRSHAEGINTTTEGDNAHAEGDSTIASGTSSHAEGVNSNASSTGAHAEGHSTIASNIGAHSEGQHTVAEGEGSHSEGIVSKASGYASHAEGIGTIASGVAQHVEGRYNKADVDAEGNVLNRYLHIVGNGESADAPSNAHTVDWNGNAWYAGNVYVGGNSQDDAKQVATLDDISDNIFVAEYGVTTYDEIQAAVQAGKAVLVRGVTITESEDINEWCYNATLTMSQDHPADDLFPAYAFCGMSTPIMQGTFGKDIYYVSTKLNPNGWESSTIFKAQTEGEFVVLNFGELYNSYVPIKKLIEAGKIVMIKDGCDYYTLSTHSPDTTMPYLVFGCQTEEEGDYIIKTMYIDAGLTIPNPPKQISLTDLVNRVAALEAKVN